MSTVWSWILLFIVILLDANVILSGFVVFYERRTPASTRAWLLVLLFIPIFGFFAYMVFGRNSKREKMFREKEKYDQEVYYKYLFQDDHSAEKITEKREINAENDAGRLIINTATAKELTRLSGLGEK